MSLQQPFRIPVVNIADPKSGRLTPGWQIYMELNANQLKTPANQAPPVNSSATGSAGQLAYDDNYLYVYSGVSNQWKRLPLQSF